VQVDLAGVQLVLQQHEKFFHRAGDPVGLVNHQGVAGLEHGEGLAQLGPLGAGAGGLDDDLAAVRVGQRVQLQLVVLGSSADAGVADAHGVAVGGRIAGGAAHRGIVPGPVPELNVAFRKATALLSEGECTAVSIRGPQGVPTRTG